MTRAEALESSSRVSDPTSSKERSFETTLAFVTDGRVNSVPIDMSQDQRNLEITGEYLGTDKTLEEIGRKHSLTRERIRQIVERNVRQLYEIQSAEVKSEYPLGQFGYHKPLPVSSRRRRSEARGGLSAKIEQGVLEGKTFPQIKEELKPRHISNARRALHGWGIEIPYEYNHILPRIEKLRDPGLTDEEKQKLLDSVKYYRVLKILSSVKKPLIIPVSRIGWQSGLFFRVDKVNFIYALLRSKGVPASSFSQFGSHRGNREKKRWTYYFVCATDRDRAIEIIKSAEELNQFRVNPVTILGKATDRIPRAGELQDSGNYSHLGSLVMEIREKSLGRYIKAEDIILDDCPASVFRYKTNRFYRLDEQEQLREYLKKRLRKLGVISAI